MLCFRTARSPCPPPTSRRPLRHARRLGLEALGAATLCALVVGSGCEQRARPWDGTLDGSVRDESQPWLRPGPDASWLAAPAASGADGGTDGGWVERVSPVGGLWVSCYGGFHPTDDPVRDVTRLGLLCGPPNGLRPLTKVPFEGKVAQGEEARTHRFEARRGECYRLFAVASPTIEDLDVAVRSSRGSRLAVDHSEDRWPILDPEGPLCTFDNDTFTVRVSAPRGRGRYALQVWKLPTRK